MNNKWEKGGLFVKMMAMKSENRARVDVKNGGKFWELWGIRLFGNSMSYLLKELIQYVTKRPSRPFWIATVNPEFVVKATEDKGFYNILQKTDLNVMDGVGLLWARLVVSCQLSVVRRIMLGIKTGIEIMRGQHREGLITGVDLMERICEEAGKNNLKVFFLGGFGDRAARTEEYFRKRFIKYDLRFMNSCGEPTISNEEVIKKIKKFEPDFMFVAYGMKKQEEWIEANLDKLKVGVVMGVGRSFDYFSGDLKRAPEVVRKMGFEWLYSLYKEPKRWRRQLALPKFVGKIIWGSR